MANGHVLLIQPVFNAHFLCATTELGPGDTSELDPGLRTSTGRQATGQITSARMSPEKGLSKTRTCDEGWSGKPSDMIVTLRPEKPEMKELFWGKRFKALKTARNDGLE